MALPTQRALCAARNELHSKAHEVLPPFDVLVSTPSPRLHVALHIATYAASVTTTLVSVPNQTEFLVRVSFLRSIPVVSVISSQS